MAFRAVIHISEDPEQLRQIQEIIARFRAEKSVKYLEAMGINYDTLREENP